MPFTTVAFYESQDAAGAWVDVAAIADQHIQTSGDDLTVPTLSQVIALAGGVGSGGDQLARLNAPSIRDDSRFEIAPLNGGADADAEPDSPEAIVDLRDSPLQLQPNEHLNGQIHSDTTAAAAQWIVVWLADGPIAPATGPIFTIRATNTDTLTADAWTNGNLTLDEDLQVGRYQIVGMRALSAGLVAARLVFREANNLRPGCLGHDDPQDIQHPMFRYGGLGVWGEFPSNLTPSVDFLSVSGDSDQEVFLDIIRTSETL